MPLSTAAPLPSSGRRRSCAAARSCATAPSGPARRPCRSRAHIEPRAATPLLRSDSLHSISETLSSRPRKRTTSPSRGIRASARGGSSARRHWRTTLFPLPGSASSLSRKRTVSSSTRGSASTIAVHVPLAPSSAAPSALSLPKKDAPRTTPTPQAHRTSATVRLPPHPAGRSSAQAPAASAAAHPAAVARTHESSAPGASLLEMATPAHSAAATQASGGMLGLVTVGTAGSAEPLISPSRGREGPLSSWDRSRTLVRGRLPTETGRWPRGPPRSWLPSPDRFREAFQAPRHRRS